MDPSIIQQNIIDLLELKNLPEEKKSALLEKMVEIIQNRITLRILDALSEKEKEELDKLMDAKKEEKIDQFLREKVPNFDALTIAEILKFKEEMVDNLKVIKEVIKK